MPSIEGRLQRLQKLAESAKGDKIAAIFKDGHTEYLTGGECIDLWKNNPLAVERFEGRSPGHGHLPDLLNDSLYDGVDGYEQ